MQQNQQAEGYVRTKEDDARQPLSPHGSESLRFKKAPCNDVIWAIAFGVQLFIIIILSSVYYSNNKDDFSSDTTSDAFVNNKFWTLTCLTVIFSILSSASWIIFVRKFAHSLIWFSLILCLAMWVIIGIVFLIAQEFIGAIIAIIFAALQGLWMYCVKDRIAFSAAVLELAVTATNTFPLSYLISFLSIFVQAFWSLIWVMGFTFVIYQGTKGDNNNVSGGVVFLFIVSFYWTSQVIANIVLVTCAGVVATWYFLYPQATPPNPVSGSLKRACWNSLGSICFGSLLIAVIQALRAMLRAGQNNNNFFIRCVIDCILSCLENILNYFNLYAFSRVAIYGQTYCDAARGTWELFKSKGFDAIINDDLTAGALMMACLFAGGCSGIIIAIIAEIMNNDYWVEWGIIAFFVGFVLTLCAMTVVRAGVVTIFVCFAEDPACLAHTKPQCYEKITDAWRNRYGKLPSRLTNP